MSKVKTMLQLLKTPKKIFYPMGQNGLFKWLPDSLYLKILYYCETGKKLNLSNPQLFTEKIQWLKLNDRQKRYIMLVDKYRVKEYVADLIGMEHIIRTIGVWDDANKIDFNSLPNQFVLKCNHDSGGICICKDRKNFDEIAARKLISKRIKRNAFFSGREWPYKLVNRKIIAEEYINSNEGELIDYKFYCFNGHPRYCQVIQNRSTRETIDFYDMNWKIQEFNGLTSAPHGEYKAKPKKFEKMKEIAEILAVGTKFVRIDLYNNEGEIFFGEFTLYPKSGFGKFYPNEWNKKLGSMISLR